MIRKLQVVWVVGALVTWMLLVSSFYGCITDAWPHKRPDALDVLMTTMVPAVIWPLTLPGVLINRHARGDGKFCFI